jgi:hypothetical protein
MAEIVQDENPRKSLYRLLLADKTPGVGDRVKKYSFPEFENRLLTDQDTQNKMGWYLESKGIVADPVDFSERYLKKAATQVPPAPKPEPAPVAIEEEEAYVPEPQPLVGSPEYTDMLEAQYGDMKPTLGATFAGTPAAFETKAQKEQEQISPVFKAQQLAFEDVPIAEEQRRAQKQFAKATKQQQQAALRGGTGFELQQERADEARDSAKYLKDFGSYIGATFDNVIDKTKAAERMFGAKQKALLTFGDRGKKAEQEEKKAKQDVYNYISQLDQEFAAKQADYNIEGNLFEAIRKGQWDRIPEAFAYNIAQVGIQALAAANTGGYSMFAQVVPDIYKSGVEEIAKKTKTTPEQVIASGNDRELLSYIGGAISGYIEKLSGGILGQAMKSQGAYKFLRDKALDKIGKTKWKQAAASAAALGGVSGIEGATELGQGLVEVATPQVAAADTFKEARENIYQELQKPETQRRLAGEFVGGAAGGGGIAAGGRGLSRVLEGDFTYGDVRKAPQRADYDVVQIDNKIQERNKIAQAMEEAVKANPEAEGQIRQQYQKRINEAAPADDEVLMAYESLALLPETEEKNTIRESLEAYMAEKGLQPQPSGMEAGLGEGLRTTPTEIQAVSPDLPPAITPEAPVAPVEEAAPVTEEAPLEELPPVTEEAPVAEEIPAEEAVPATGMFEDLQGPVVEEAAPQTGMFEGLAGPQAEEEVVSAAPVEEALVAAEEVVAEEPVKPTPTKLKVLGKDVNMYSDYIPSRPEDVEPDAMYVFNADSKDGIPPLLQDVAYANKKETNGVKTENWHATISGEDLLKLYPKKETKTASALPSAAPAPKGRKKQPAAPKPAPATPPAPKAPETKPSEKAPKGLQIDSDEIARRIAEQNNRLVEGKILDNQGNPIYDLSGGIAVNGITTLTDKKYGHGSTKASEAESFNILADILNTGNFSGWFGENKGNRIFTSGKFFIASNNIDGGGKGKIDPSEVEVILNVGLTPFAQDLANRFPQTTIKDYNGNIYKPQTTTTTQSEFTSKQEGNASTEFDGTKKPSKIKTKSFDNKYGKGAFERMQNITQNFEDIMDGLSEKIKQDCL